MNKKKLVVIGNGMAGVKCIEELLHIDDSLYEITVFGSEPYPNYNRIMLSKVLQGNSSMDEIVIHPLSWYQEKGIKLYTDTLVTTIDTKQKFIETNKGVTMQYDRLILATGSSAFIPKLSGVDKAGVTGFRNIDDCLAMIEASKTYHRAAVIGGGILGLEAAKGLLHLGMEVNIVHNASYIMNRQLDPISANLLQKELEEQGMRFLLNKRTERILGRTRTKGLLFEDGTKLAVDYIVFAVGIKPRIELADGSGIQANRAFIVDDFMQTNIPDVYAVGECAEHRGVVYGLVAPLYEQGKILARTLCGVTTEGYGGTIPSAQLKISGIDVFSAGNTYDAAQQTALQMFDAVNGSYKKVTMSDGKVTGAILYGNINEATQLLSLIKKQSLVAELFREQGTNSNDDAAAALAPKDTVCSCNGVCKSDIVSAVCKDGLETLEQVRDRTKASGSCGGCRPLVEAIIRKAIESPELEPEVKEPICRCSSVDHQTLIDEITSNIVAEPASIMSRLDWKNEVGCVICHSAIYYYTDVHSSLSSGRASGNTTRNTIANVQPRICRTTIHVASELRGELSPKSMEALWLKDQLEQSVDDLLMPQAATIAISAGTSFPAGVMVSSFGLMATPVGWELYIGGHAELPLQQGKLLTIEATTEQILDIAISSIQWYRQSAFYGEPVWMWLERLGIINIREKLLNPIERQKLNTSWYVRQRNKTITGISTFV